MTPDSSPMAVGAICALVLAYFAFDKLRAAVQSNQRVQQLKKARLMR